MKGIHTYIAHLLARAILIDICTYSFRQINNAMVCDIAEWNILFYNQMKCLLYFSVVRSSTTFNNYVIKHAFRSQYSVLKLLLT